MNLSLKEVCCCFFNLILLCRLLLLFGKLDPIYACDKPLHFMTFQLLYFFFALNLEMGHCVAVSMMMGCIQSQMNYCLTNKQQPHSIQFLLKSQDPAGLSLGQSPHGWQWQINRADEARRDGSEQEGCCELWYNLQRTRSEPWRTIHLVQRMTIPWSWQRRWKPNQLDRVCSLSAGGKEGGLRIDVICECLVRRWKEGTIWPQQHWTEYLSLKEVALWMDWGKKRSRIGGRKSG